MSSAALGGKTAIVTGASNGIGQACANLLAEDGASVLIMSRTEKALARTRDQMVERAPDAQVEILVGDACQEAAVKVAVERAYAMSGRLDIVVPTVGGPEYHPVTVLDPAMMARALDFNFMSVFLMVHHALPKMKPGGSIVCISSAAAGQANMGLSAYGAAKAALERWVRAAAFELGAAGIRINAVRAGATLAQALIESRNMHQMANLYAAETPLGRIGEPYDIARVVRFLAGPESGWITGESIAADGGMQQGKAPDLGAALANWG